MNIDQLPQDKSNRLWCTNLDLCCKQNECIQNYYFDIIFRLLQCLVYFLKGSIAHLTGYSGNELSQ